MTDTEPVDEYLQKALAIIADMETANIPPSDQERARQLVSSELAELESLAASRPLHAEEIEAVAARYRAVRIRLRQKLGSNSAPPRT